MSRKTPFFTLPLVAAILIALTAAADAQRKRERQQVRPPPKAQPADPRDSVVSAPGNTFNRRPYWQALGQCGGIYFRLTELYMDSAFKARVVKPDKAADTRLSKSGNEARRIATTFFTAAERFLIADRGVNRENAIMTYDAKANEAGGQIKTVDSGLTAARPCPELYQACHAAFSKICNDTPPSLSQAGAN
jgi:hypothetical protein